ncbi:MAG: tyrosine-type recombinase/integrase [Pseudomonadota bacterium]
MRTRLPDPSREPTKFHLAYARLREGVPSERHVIPGSVADYCERYQLTAEFRDLAISTRRVYLTRLQDLETTFGQQMISAFTQADIWKIRDGTTGTDNKANGRVKMLSLLCTMAVREGRMRANPCIGVKMRGKSKGHNAWPQEHIRAFQGRWARGTVQRACFDLALFTGQRRSDIAKLTWQDAKGGLIRITQRKTGTAVEIPIHPELAETLERTPRNGPFIIATSAGGQRSDKAMGNWFAKAREAAIIPNGYVLHGLRATAATQLIEAGCSPQEAAAITGHKDLKMLNHYARSRDQKRLAKTAVKRWTKGESGKLSGKPAPETA